MFFDFQLKALLGKVLKWREKTLFCWLAQFFTSGRDGIYQSFKYFLGSCTLINFSLKTKFKVFYSTHFPFQPFKNMPCSVKLHIQIESLRPDWQSCMTIEIFHQVTENCNLPQIIKIKKIIDNCFCLVQ